MSIFDFLKTGEQLSLVSGVAAILKFPMPEIEEIEMGGYDDSSDESSDEEPVTSNSKREEDDAADAFGDFF